MIIKALFLLTIYSSCHGAIDIGKYLKTCPRNSPDVNDCLTDAISSGIAVLTKGIKELDIEPLDPYYQKELKMEYSKNQIKAKILLNDIYVSGLSEATVRDARLKANEDSFYMEVDMFSPYVNVKARYAGEGGYNALTVNSTGTNSVNMSVIILRSEPKQLRTLGGAQVVHRANSSQYTDLIYTWKLKGKPETIDNEVYVRITSFYMRPDVGNMKVGITTDNPDLKEILQLGVRLSNENWRTMYKELLPLAQSNWNDIGVAVANKIFLKVPYDQLFPNTA